MCWSSHTNSLGMIHWASKDARKTVIMMTMRRIGCIECIMIGVSMIDEGDR